MVHARTLFGDPGPRGARRHRRLAAEGAMRLSRSDGRLRLPRRADRLAPRRQFRDDRPCRHGRRPCRQAGRDHQPTLHPRHAPRPLRQRRLEQFAAAGRPGQARLADQQLDSRAALPAASPLRRDPAPRRPLRGGQEARRAGLGDEERFRALLRPRRRGRRLRHVQSDGRAARTASPPQRPDHRRLFLPDFLDPGHSRRPADAGPGAARGKPDDETSAAARRRSFDGQAARLSRRAGDDLPPRRIGRVFRPRNRADVRACAPALRRSDGAVGDSEALWDALVVANPIAVTETLAHAAFRQRNAYFSSSDAAFRDRYEASANWELAKSGEIAVEGGWRIFSSGPGLYVSLVVRHALGAKRRFGKRVVRRSLPASQKRLRLAGVPPAR